MTRILTSLSALYKQDIISFSPKNVYIEMENGTNIATLSKNNIKYSFQSKATIGIGVITVNGQKMYCPERLLVELNKFPLENTIKIEAIRNLEKIVNPELVSKIYKILKNKRKKIDKNYIENFLDKKILNIKLALIKDSKKNLRSDPKSILREYIMTMLCRKDIPITLIKGGSSIEIFSLDNRSTLDIDLCSSKKDVMWILKYLANEENDIYFQTTDEINLDKKIIKLNLIPKTRKHSIKHLIAEVKSLPISFNTSLDQAEIVDIIKNYNVTKMNLKRLNNHFALVFTKEMLIAEKYQAIISKPTNSKRTKDLLDLYWLVTNNNYDFQKFKKWYFLKWSKNNDSKTQEQSIEVVINNKDLPLTHMKLNFDDAKKMYDLQMNYEDCWNVYYQISIRLINDR